MAAKVRPLPAVFVRTGCSGTIPPEGRIAILDAVEEERADVLVVGNAGMSGRKQFLLGNIPNRVSHGARCTVVIVNTTEPDGTSGERPRGATADASQHTEGRLLGRAWRIGRVVVKSGVREHLTRPRPNDDEAVREAARRFRLALDELGPTLRCSRRTWSISSRGIGTSR